jgi:hypothetical protein
VRGAGCGVRGAGAGCGGGGRAVVHQRVAEFTEGRRTWRPFPTPQPCLQPAPPNAPSPTRAPIPAHPAPFPHLHVLVQPVADDQPVCHAYPVRLHRVPLPVVEVPNLGIIIIRDLGAVACARACALGGHNFALAHEHATHAPMPDACAHAVVAPCAQWRCRRGEWGVLVPHAMRCIMQEGLQVLPPRVLGSAMRLPWMGAPSATHDPTFRRPDIFRL